MNGFVEMYIRTFYHKPEHKNRQGPSFPTPGTTRSLLACHNRSPSRDLNDDMPQCRRHIDVVRVASPVSKNKKHRCSWYFSAILG